MAKHTREDTMRERSAKLVARARKLLDNWDDESQIDRALRLFEQATSLTPDDAEAWRGVGDAQHENEEYEAAAAAYERAITLGLDDAHLWRRLASAYAWFPGHADESVAAAERARALAPDDVTILREFAEALTRAGFPDQPGRLERALDAVDHLLTLDAVSQAPESRAGSVLDEALCWKGGLLIALNRAEEALAIFKQLKSNASQRTIEWQAVYANHQASYGEAIIYTHLGRDAEALAALELGLVNVSANSLIWQSFHAELLVRLGRPEEGLAEAEKALQQGSGKLFAYPWQVYARALSALGREEEARTADQQVQGTRTRPQLVELLLPNA